MNASFAIIVARLAGYLSTSVLFGTPLFLLYASGLDALRSERRSWPLRATAAAASGAAIATLAWVMLQTASMSGDSKAAFDPAALWAFLSETPFGRAALVRILAAGVAFSVLVAAPRPSRSLWSVTAGLGAVVVTSLAWSGHGASEDGAVGMAHLAADVLHLLAAAAWVGALLAFLILILRSKTSRAEADAHAAEAALAGFSGVGTVLVAVLLLSGAVNGWFLIGPSHLDALGTTAYGRLLLAKLVLFVAMLCLAAANRYLLTPRLTEALNRSGMAAPAVTALRTSVMLEFALAVLVLAAVSWLGALMPPTGTA